MWFVARRVVGALVFVFNTLVPGPTDARQPPIVVQDIARQPPSVVQDIGQRPFIQRPIPKGGRNRSLRFARTELYFGTARPDGAVTDEEFQAFIDREVTSRFPRGLTVVKAQGQFDEIAAISRPVSAGAPGSGRREPRSVTRPARFPAVRPATS